MVNTRTDNSVSAAGPQEPLARHHRKRIDERRRSQLADGFQFLGIEAAAQVQIDHGFVVFVGLETLRILDGGGAGSSVARIASRSSDASRMNAAMSGPSATT